MNHNNKEAKGLTFRRGSEVSQVVSFLNIQGLGFGNAQYSALLIDWEGENAYTF